MDSNFDWDSLEDHVAADGTFAPPAKKGTSEFAKTQDFPCTQCGGSGKYRGMGKCYACNGKGSFKTSAADRVAASHKRAAKKVATLAEIRDAFDAANPGLHQFLAKASEWSSFAGSLSAAIAQYGSLTEKQLQAARGMQAKLAANAEAKAAEKVAGAAIVDLSPIREMFEMAVANGYKKPAYRAEGLKITRAPNTGRNPGALYVVSDETDEYLGKIIGTQYSGKPAVALAAISADPKGAAIRYGQRTGTCSCCGRLLTNEGSIEAGIGPICATKWGL